MSTYIGQVKVGQETAPIASSIYGVCTDSAATVNKVVTLTNFNKELHGVTIFVYFTQGNTVISGATMNVNNTGAYNIEGNCFCGPNSVLGFTLDISAINQTTGAITASWRCITNAPMIGQNAPLAVSNIASTGNSSSYSREDHVHAISVTAGAAGSEEITVGGTTITLPIKAYAPTANPTFTGVVTLPSIDNNSADSAAATKLYVDQKLNAGLGAAEAMIFKGTIGSNSENPTPTVTSLPSSDYKKGWTYKVVTAGTYANLTCEVGDIIIAIADAAANQSSINNAHWTVAQGNVDSSLYKGTNTLVNEHILLADGTNGQVKDSGSGIAGSINAGSTSVNIPTSAAVATFVEGKGYVTSSQVGVTKVTAGIGLVTANGSDITSIGTIKAKLKSETALTADSAVGTETTNRNYAIVTDHSGYLAVSVPWTDTKVTQTGVETNESYAILLKNTTGTTDETNGVKFGKASGKLVTVNPSTGVITAAGFSGALNSSDIATALGVDNSVTTATFWHKSGAWKTLSIDTIASISNGVLTLNNAGLIMT